MHPRFFPHITSYSSQDTGEVVEFVYVKPLQPEWAIRCVCFEAVIPKTAERIVVKFAESKYGEGAHRYMADRGWAPALRYFVPLDPCRYARLAMVVMNKVQGGDVGESGQKG